jgi:hypothetical protein
VIICPYRYWYVLFVSVSNTPITHLQSSSFSPCRHYSVPLIPDLPGLGSFSGRVIHSHVYRYPEDFADGRVLVIGGGASGTDIAMDLASHAKQVRRKEAKEMHHLCSLNY